MYARTQMVCSPHRPLCHMRKCQPSHHTPHPSASLVPSSMECPLLSSWEGIGGEGEGTKEGGDREREGKGNKGRGERMFGCIHYVRTVMWSLWSPPRATHLLRAPRDRPLDLLLSFFSSGGNIRARPKSATNAVKSCMCVYGIYRWKLQSVQMAKWCI